MTLLSEIDIYQVGQRLTLSYDSHGVRRHREGLLCHGMNMLLPPLSTLAAILMNGMLTGGLS